VGFRAQLSATQRSLNACFWSGATSASTRTAAPPSTSARMLSSSTACNSQAVSRTYKADASDSSAFMPRTRAWNPLAHTGIPSSLSTVACIAQGHGTTLNWLSTSAPRPLALQNVDGTTLSWMKTPTSCSHRLAPLRACQRFVSKSSCGACWNQTSPRR